MKKAIALICTICLLSTVFVGIGYAAVNAALCDSCGDGEVYLMYTDNEVDVPHVERIGVYNGRPAMFFDYYKARDYFYRCGFCDVITRITRRDNVPYHSEVAYYL